MPTNATRSSNDSTKPGVVNNMHTFTFLYRVLPEALTEIVGDEVVVKKIMELFQGRVSLLGPEGEHYYSIEDLQMDYHDTNRVLVSFLLDLGDGVFNPQTGKFMEFDNVQ